MKKVLIVLISLVAVGSMAYTLYANKEEMEENAKLADITSDAIPVETTTAERIALNSEVSVNGTFEAISDLVMLSETQGKVVKVYVDKGALVRKGALLAQVENELLQTQVTVAQSNYEKLKSDLARFTKLLESEAVTERQVEDVRLGLMNAEAQYRAAKKRYEDTYIRASTSGSINNDFIQEGAFVAPGARLYEIVDISKLSLEVKLTAREALNVAVGDEVNITSPVYPGISFSGVVTSIAAKADGTLKYAVELQMANNTEHQLKPGMYATAHFEFEKTQPSLYLNRRALVGSLQNPQVFVVYQDSLDKVRLVDLTVGEVTDNRVEVLKGIDENDRVVLTGQINLTEGTRVRQLNQD